MMILPLLRRYNFLNTSKSATVLVFIFSNNNKKMEIQYKQVINLNKVTFWFNIKRKIKVW